MADPCHENSPPKASVYLANLDTTWLILIIVAACVSVAVVCVYLEEVFFIMKNLRQWRMRNKVLYLLGLYPVFALTSVVALLVPKSEDLDELASSLYLSIALYVFVTMLIGHYGGKKRMSTTLSYHVISPRVPPVCCCCCCLPDIPVSPRNVQILQFMVLQYAIFKPLGLYIWLILLVNDRDDVATGTVQANVYSIATSTSSLLALWANVMLFRLSAEPLKHLSIKPKFYALQLVLMTDNLQKTVLGWFATGGVLTCTEQLDTTSATLRMNALLKVFEMLLISLLARRHYRRDQQEWFKFEEDDDDETCDPGALENGPDISRSEAPEEGPEDSKSITLSSNHNPSYGTITEK